MTTSTAQEASSERPLMNAAQLDKLGVRRLNRWNRELECKNCLERWSPERDPSGHLMPGYWKCPNRCNW